jgi:hypothetical protein
MSGVSLLASEAPLPEMPPPPSAPRLPGEVCARSMPTALMTKHPGVQNTLQITLFRY